VNNRIRNVVLESYVTYQQMQYTLLFSKNTRSHSVYEISFRKIQ